SALAGFEYACRTMSSVVERGEIADSFSSMYDRRRTMLLSFGLPLTVQRDVMSNESPMRLSAASASVNVTLLMFGRPSITGLIVFASTTRVSAIESGWIGDDPLS